MKKALIAGIFFLTFMSTGCALAPAIPSPQSFCIRYEASAICVDFPTMERARPNF